MKKILTLAIFLFVLTVSHTFGEKDRYRIFECSDEFKKIKEAFRERLYDACLEKEYFYYEIIEHGLTLCSRCVFHVKQGLPK
jgi:hypothetical protein